MGLLTKAQFEHRLTSHLDEVSPGLAGRSKRRVGYAWDLIINHMYAKHGDNLTFANVGEVIAECAQAITQLMCSVKDE